MPFIRLSTGSLHYAEYGQGDPVVLLHANPGDSQDFAAIIPALSEHYRVFALDWPGYGQSAMPPSPSSTTARFFTDVLKAFFDALSLPPAVIIGNSVGGNAATRMAIEQPEKVRGLVLVAPGGFTPHNVLTRSFCRLQSSRFSLSPHVFARLYLKRQTPTTKAMLRRAAGPQATPAARILNRAVWRSFGQAENDLRAAASSINVPTLLLFGKHDPAISASKDGREAAMAIPSAKRVTLPCGHASFAEMPHLFLRETLPFLAQFRAKEHGLVASAYKDSYNLTSTPRSAI